MKNESGWIYPDYFLEVPEFTRFPDGPLCSECNWSAALCNDHMILTWTGKNPSLLQISIFKDSTEARSYLSYLKGTHYQSHES